MKTPKSYPKTKEVDMFDWVLEEGKNPNVIWETKEHQAIRIVDLRDSHLENIVKVFKEKPYWRRDQQPVIYAEIERRKIAKMIKKTKSGKLLYGK